MPLPFWLFWLFSPPLLEGDFLLTSSLLRPVLAAAVSAGGAERCRLRFALWLTSSIWIRAGCFACWRNNAGSVSWWLKKRCRGCLPAPGSQHTALCWWPCWEQAGRGPRCFRLIYVSAIKTNWLCSLLCSPFCVLRVEKASPDLQIIRIFFFGERLWGLERYLLSF